jgi:hypothetical protein
VLLCVSLLLCAAASVSQICLPAGEVLARQGTETLRFPFGTLAWNTTRTFVDGCARESGVVYL